MASILLAAKALDRARLRSNADEMLGAPPVRRSCRTGFGEFGYGKDASLIGRTIRVGGTPTTVVGVMPRGFGFPFRSSRYMDAAQSNGRFREAATAPSSLVYARMADGVKLKSAQAENDHDFRALAGCLPRYRIQGSRPGCRTFHGLLCWPRLHHHISGNARRGQFRVADRLRQCSRT